MWWVTTQKTGGQRLWDCKECWASTGTKRLGRGGSQNAARDGAAGTGFAGRDSGSRRKLLGRTQRGPAGPKPEKQSIDRSGQLKRMGGASADSHEENPRMRRARACCLSWRSASSRAAWCIPTARPAYSGLAKEGYVHQVTVVSRHKQSASELMPRVHRVMSLLKRWLLGTHQGAVSHKHLDYYLDEFTFRFNRRKSKSRGKLFYRARPAGGGRGSRDLQDDCSPGYRTQENPKTTRYWGYLSQPDTHLFVFLCTSITSSSGCGSPVKWRSC